MPKTDPEIITLGAVDTVTVTAPSTLDGATVQSIEGGTVTRADAPLAGGETLQSGETLTFTPTTAGGTTYLNVRLDNAEFSGHYDDLDGKPDGTGATGPAGRGIASITVSGSNLTGTYSDGTAWDAGELPAGSGGGLDAEAVQDIVGQMLGETQGHYDDVTGTYTIKQRGLPSGGAAGQVLTKAGGSDYDAEWATPTASGGHAQATVPVTFASAGNQNVPAPYALGILRKIEFSTAARVACYPSAEARASDQTRFDGNPTLAPNVPVITQAQALGATTIAINEAYTGTTLYLRSSASCTVTLTIEEA